MFLRQAFISHRYGDPEAHRIASAMKERKLLVSIVGNELPFGPDDDPDAIRKWIEQNIFSQLVPCRVLIVASAGDALRSRWIRFEALFGMMTSTCSFLLWSKGPDPISFFPRWWRRLAWCFFDCRVYTVDLRSAAPIAETRDVEDEMYTIVGRLRPGWHGIDLLRPLQTALGSLFGWFVMASLIPLEWTSAANRVFVVVYWSVILVCLALTHRSHYRIRAAVRPRFRVAVPGYVTTVITAAAALGLVWLPDYGICGVVGPLFVAVSLVLGWLFLRSRARRAMTQMGVELRADDPR